MFIFKSVVGKLWMTIIALVAVVLIILGLFLFSFIDTRFPTNNDQNVSLHNLSDRMASDAATHRNDRTYLSVMSDLLKAQDAGMLMLDLSAPIGEQSLSMTGGQQVPLHSIFSSSELSAITAGSRITKTFPVAEGKTKEDFLIITTPVSDIGTAKATHSLIVFQSKKSLENTQLYVKKLFAYVSIIGFLLTTFFAFFLITRITRPIVELKKMTGFIARGEYRKRVPVISHDEIGELTQAFNLMGDQLEGTINDLNNEKDNLASVLRSMGDAVISFDVEGKIIFMNPEGERLLADWSQIQWEWGEPEDEIDPGTGQASETDLNERKGVRSIPEPLKIVFESVVRDTKEITSQIHVHNGVWSIVMAPLYSKEVVRGAVAVLRDVTEENKLDKLRKDFVANVSHELRTPISMLQGYSEALLDDIAASPEDRRELAQVIHDESLRMGRLVKDLLDLARMETGHMELNFDHIDLSPLLRRVHRKFSAYARDQGISLELNLHREHLPLERADEDRLEQVLTNLLDNAIRHSASDSSIIIRTKSTKLKDREAVDIEVEDQGQGIPADDLPYIFERFYKADKARTRGASGGTGLGLAIVKNIVDAHGGTIYVRSTVGQGTTFSILLPVNAA